MRKFILLSLVAVFIFGAACGGSSKDDHSRMNHDSMNHNSMSHNSANTNAIDHSSHGPMASDPGAADAPYDLQFIDSMIHHHEGALVMSGLALKKSSHEELKQFAQKIVDDQKREIAQMKEWREKWYAGKPPAKNMEMAGMMDSMRTMTDGMMKNLEAANGKDFDLLFLELMSGHHDGAVIMATEAQQKAEHSEIKTLAGQIIEAQQAEIKKMSDWRVQWMK